MRTRPMHVVIENTVALNTGDAAILVAIIDIVRETFGSGTRFSIFDSAPEVAKRYYPEFQFHPLVTELLSGRVRLFGRERKTLFKRPLQRAQRAALRRTIAEAKAGRASRPSWLLDQRVHDLIALYRSADLIISTGGTYLVEHYKLHNRFDELQKDLSLGKPLVLFTQSLGPFTQARNQGPMKHIAQGALLVLLRDVRSAAHLRDIGVAASQFEVVADSVFALARPDWLEAPVVRDPGRPLRVAVSVRRWTHYEGLDRNTGTQRYESAIAAAVSALVREAGAEVVFLSTCQGVPEYLYDDSQVAARIREGLEDDVKRAVRVDTDFHSPTDLMQVLRGFDFAISTRMHMAILGLCSGVPVLPIAYEFKTTEVYKALGQGEWVTDISAIEAASFKALALRFVQAFGRFRTEVAPRVLEHAASARSAGRLIAERLSAASTAESQA